MRIIWSEIAQATFVHSTAEQARMMAVYRAAEGSSLRLFRFQVKLGKDPDDRFLEFR